MEVERRTQAEFKHGKVGFLQAEHLRNWAAAELGASRNAVLKLRANFPLSC